MQQLDDYARISFLVVDDFQGFRGVVRDILREKGASNIDFCIDGKEAISKLERKSADVVLCDYNLGPGKNGQQLLEECKVRNLIGPACIWIMVTGEKTTEVVFSAAEYQPDAYLVKPISAQVLFSRLEKIWAKKEGLVEIDRALRAKEYRRALRACDERMAIDKANVTDLIRLKCNILLTMGDLDSVAQTYQNLLARRDFHWARTGLGKVLFLQGKYGAAKTMLESVIADNPSYIEAYDWLAKTLQALHESNAAKQVLQDAIRLSPNSPTRQKFLGDMAYETGDLDLAAKAFRKSVASGENSVFKSPDVYLSLAKTCSAKKDPDEALRILAGLKKEFKSPEIAFKAKVTEGLVYQDNNEPDKAYDVAVSLTRMVDGPHMPTDASFSLQMAQLMMQSGGIAEREKALEVMQSLVKNNADDKGMLESVQALFKKADMEEAGTRIIEESRVAATEMMNKGVLLLREEKYDEALEWMRQARGSIPNNPRVLFNTAYVMVVWLEKMGMDDRVLHEARSALEEANKIQAGDKRYFNLTSRIDVLLHRA